MNDKDLARFMSKVEIREGSECWFWTGYRTKPHGYCQFKVNRIPHSAHTEIYKHLVGEIPARKAVKPSCGTDGCVNPAHLRLALCGNTTVRSIETRKKLSRAHKGRSNPKRSSKIIDGVTVKLCADCGEWKPSSDYFSDRSRWDGLSYRCKVCNQKRSSAYQKANRDKGRAWSLRHRLKDPERFKAQQLKYYHEKRKMAPKYRISAAMRAGIYLSLHGNKDRAWESLVDYTVDDLMDRLASCFQPGMSFDNHGDWHIDHRRPIASFDFTTSEDPGFKECWALSNLQPLWAKDNCSKGARYEN